MVVGFADEVDHSLDDEAKENQLEQKEEEDDCKQNSVRGAQWVPQHNQVLKSQLNYEITDVEDEENCNCNSRLALNQGLALHHGLDPIAVFQHRYNARQMPDYAYIHKPHDVYDQEKEEDHESKDVVSYQDSPHEQNYPGDNVVAENNDEVPYEGDHESLPHLWDYAQDPLEGYLLGAVHAGNRIHNCGCAEEGEDEEEGEICDLQKPKDYPLGGNNIGELLIFGGSSPGSIQLVLIPEDLEKEEIRDFNMSEENEGEREDES